MSTTVDQRRILGARPIHRMRWFASLLNWHGLQLEWVLPHDVMEQTAVPDLVVYYMTTDPKFNLQINEVSSGQSITHQATIKAYRYGIRHVDWHAFTLSDDNAELMSEADRLRPYLDRSLYRNREWRTELKLRHPEIMLPSRKKRRGRSRISPF